MLPRSSLPDKTIQHVMGDLRNRKERHQHGMDRCPILGCPKEPTSIVPDADIPEKLFEIS